MEIRNARKGDLEEYLKLREEYLKSIQERDNKQLEFNKDKIKREFKEFFKKNKIAFLAEENGNIVGYVYGNISENVWRKGGYIDDIYVLKKYRRKGVAKLLLKEFLKILKIKTCQLGVSKKNKKAIGLYKQFGFDIVHYEMGKELR